MPNNTSAHVTSLTSLVVAILTVLHPGFTLPAGVEAALVSVAGLIGGGAQFLHINLKREWLRGYNEYQVAQAWVKAELAKASPAVASTVEDTAKTAVTDAVAAVKAAEATEATPAPVATTA